MFQTHQNGLPRDIKANSDELAARLITISDVKKVIEVSIGSFSIHISEVPWSCEQDARFSIFMPYSEHVHATLGKEGEQAGPTRFASMADQAFDTQNDLRLVYADTDLLQTGVDCSVAWDTNLVGDRILVGLLRAVWNQTMHEQTDVHREYMNEFYFIEKDCKPNNDRRQLSYLALTTVAEFWKDALKNEKTNLARRQAEVTSFIILLLIMNPMAVKQLLAFHHLHHFFPALHSVMENFSIANYADYRHAALDGRISVQQTGVYLLAAHSQKTVTEILEMCVPVLNPRF